MSILPGRTAEVAHDSDGVEFELKLTGPLAVLAAAFQAIEPTGTGAVRRLTSVYFDTPDRRLAERGWSLRVRDRGDGFVQTLKADVLAAERLELEAPVASLSPEIDLLRADAVRGALGAIFPEDLEACFTTAVERATRDLSKVDALGREGRVELAFDQGEIRVPDGRIEPVAELEIECKEGDRQAVFAVARDLVALGATRLLVRSKAARGHDLGAARPPGATKAGRIELERDMPVGRALGAMLESCYAQWYANHDAAFDGARPEGVHQLRVAIRRLRSVLTLFGPYLAPARLDWLKTEARAVMTTLGPARDLDVFIDELLPPVALARPNDPGLGAVRVATAEARARAYEDVRTMLSSERYTRFVLDLGAWIDRRGWLGDADRTLHASFDAPIGPVADALVAKRAKVVRKRGRHFERLDPEARHQVRIALKKLRYAIDFTRGLYPQKQAKPYLAHLARLQDAFGHLNDQAQAETLLDGLAGDGEVRLREGRGLILGWYAHAAVGNADELLQDWRAFEAARPFWREDGSC